MSASVHETSEAMAWALALVLSALIVIVVAAFAWYIVRGPNRSMVLLRAWWGLGSLWSRW